MPDETPTEQPKEQPTDTPPNWVKDLAAGVGREVAKTLQENRQAAQPQPQQTYQEPQEVPEEDYIAAIEAGDKSRAAQIRRHNDAVREQRNRREWGNQFSQGIDALSELARNSLANDEEAKPYLAEIDAEIEKFRRSNPGTIVRPEHYRYVKENVLGRHAKEIRAQAQEATIRRLRETGFNVKVTDGVIGRDEPEHQPEDDITEFAEKGSKFDEAWRQKSRAHGGRSADEEVRLMAARSHRLAGTYDEEASKTSGRPVFRKVEYKNGIKDFWKEHQAMKRYAEEHPTLGLDE